ncbi:hypothetical protein [Cryobacterium sp. TMT2-23]|uniref:hypothetical protein n=1 Tax=Cryobacterium sp. TMT2-23 TaxID=1259252 RepID=UPI00106C4039|nr:hypothetical protein [Cryobacterium sp. TMT2-23]TFD19987.1 hypothetical protein E3T32_09370 [Cryobacterium sp. TMT2-23]
MKIRFVAAAATVLLLALTGCTNDTGGNSAPVGETPAATAESAAAAHKLTAACASAFSEAEVDLHAMYDSGLEDDEAAFTAALDPLFGACESPADLYAGGVKHPFVYGLTDGLYLDRTTLKIYCGGYEATPACTGMDSFQP